MILFLSEEFDGLTVRRSRVSFGAVTIRKSRIMFGLATARPSEIRAAITGAAVRRSNVRGAWWTGATARKSEILLTVPLDGATIRRCRIGFTSWQPAAYTYRYFLNGDDVTGLIENGLSIAFAGDRVHNEVSFSSISADLRRMIYRGALFDVVVSGDFSENYSFVIERDSGDQVKQSYSGRSISALKDKGETTVTPGLASSVAAALIDGCAWNEIDYLLPDEYGFAGNPFDGLADLAGITASVVRSDPDGAVRVRKRMPVRPVVQPAATPAIRLDNWEIIGNPAGEWKAGTGEGRVFVYGYSFGNEPDSDIEETGLPIGSDVHARIWWETDNPPDLSAWTSDGTVIPAGFESIVIEEDITFQEGPVTVGKPIENLIGFEWIGADGGALSWERYSKELTAENIPAVGRVKYRARFQRLVARGHEVARLLLALDMLTGLDTSVDLIIDESDPAAPAVTETRIPSVAVAVARGTAELDKIRYARHEISFEADYHPDLWDGAVVYLGHPENDTAGNYLIEAGSYTFNGPQVKASLQAVRFGFS